MIQRIQTLYFLLATIALSLLFFFPYALIYIKPDVPVSLSIQGLGGDFFLKNQQYLFVISTVLNALIIGIIIFTVVSVVNINTGTKPYLHKQLLYSTISFFLVMANIAWLLYFFVDLIKPHLDPANSGELMKVEYTWVMYAPIAAMFFLVLARKAIRKDYAKVSALDRLR